MSSSRLAVPVGVVSLLLFCASEARAEAPWVDRAITLPGRAWAFNLGMGVGHVPNAGLAPALNLEGGVSVAHGVEIGLRTGLRFNDLAREADADAYGRPFDTVTYGQGSDMVANPEFYIRARLVESQVVELGIEGRAYAPFSRGFGIMPGMPLAFHFGRTARLDTGVYIPILFYDPTFSFISIPLHLWFQVSRQLWLGPMSGFVFETRSPNHTEIPLGFGLGYSVTSALDFKTQILFRDVAHGSSSEWWGFGFGLEVRIE
jgi:hypothetical protein